MSLRLQGCFEEQRLPQILKCRIFQNRRLESCQPKHRRFGGPRLVTTWFQASPGSTPLVSWIYYAGGCGLTSGKCFLWRATTSTLSGYYKRVPAPADTGRTYEAYDLLKSDSRFDEDAFTTVWDSVFDFCA